MALMFVSFLLQIGFRYFLNQPLGWTDEVTVLCWVWAVLWCAAFVLSDQDEIRFDIVYGVVSPGTQRVFTATSSIAIVLLFLVSLPASWNYVTFMKREHTAYLHMRFDFLYAVYVIFAVAIIVKHVFLAWRTFKLGEGRTLCESPDRDYRHQVLPGEAPSVIDSEQCRPWARIAAAQIEGAGA
jgi:TRAP-type C4-dicarboxylate transport system permease small subunit